MSRGGGEVGGGADQVGGDGREGRGREAPPAMQKGEAESELRSLPHTPVARVVQGGWLLLCKQHALLASVPTEPFVIVPTTTVT